MFMNIKIILSVFLLQQFTNACTITDPYLVNTTAKIVNVEAPNVQISHDISGTVKIISGCSFFVKNMTIVPSGNSVYWYGVPKDNTTKDNDVVSRVVLAALGSYNGQSITFNLDPQYSFSDFKILEIRSEGDGRAYGALSLGGNVDEHYKAGKNNGLDFENGDPFKSDVQSLFSYIAYTFLLLFFTYCSLAILTITTIM